MWSGVRMSKVMIYFAWSDRGSHVQGHGVMVHGQGFVCPRSWVHYARSIHTVVAFTEILIMDISEKRLVLCTVLVGLKMLIMGNAGRRSFYVQCQYFSNC